MTNQTIIGIAQRHHATNPTSNFDQFFADIPVITTTVADKVLWVNPAAERLLGQNKSKLMMSSLFDFFIPEVPSKTLGREVAQTNGFNIVRGVLLSLFGRSVPCDLAAWPADSYGGHTEIHIVVRVFQSEWRTLRAAA
jgi:PAS domain-containing protein